MSRTPHLVYEFDGFRLDPRRRSLTSPDGKPIALTGQAFDALVYLVEHAGELVPRAALVEALWPSTVVEENSLSQAISLVRRALDDRCIATVARRGYQFVADVRVLAAPDATVDAATPGDVRSPPQPMQPAARRTDRRLAVVGALIGAAGALAATWWLVRGAGEPADPLLGASYRRLTDFEGAEEHAAISRDGRFVAFLSDRDGTWDVWVGATGTGDFQNLTRGTLGEIRNPAVRTLGFHPDGGLVTLWTRRPDATSAGMVDAGWAVPIVGGPVRQYFSGIAELDWSPDGRRLVYHTSAEGDPLFVTDIGEPPGRQIYAAPPGVHCHFPVWSPDGRALYFVKGLPDEADVWRIDAAGGEPERLTNHNSRVSFPTLLDSRTLLYLAAAPDGSGPWVHALDLDRRTTRRLNTGVDAYRSLAASSDGRRIVATVATSASQLWRLPLDDLPAVSASATAIGVPTPRSTAPRGAAGMVVYRAPKAGIDSVWRLTNGNVVELWSGANGRVVAGPVLAPDGSRVAFAVQTPTATRLYIANADGSGARSIATLDVRGAPAWSPDGRWIATAALRGGTPNLYKIPAGGGDAVPLGDDYALDPAWSPDGEFLVYTGADVGTNFALAAVNADGSARAVPRLELSRGSRRLDFLGDDVVFLKGTLSLKELWAMNLTTGAERALTALGPGELIADFDVVADGREVLFDRGRDASDIVLIERPAR
jgi:Tol biopolymer transport system component/DNA-binding winged helix-turn-helix (wHTH) protein